MIPLRLELKNFLSYREATSLDFSSIRIACLAGDNGAGKSALLDAITWALWGKTRASNDRDVVSIGANEMEVTFTFQLGQREYRVFRRRSYARSRSGQQAIEVSVREPGAETWLPISGDSVRDTQEKLIRLLTMEYDTFVNSAFVLQGRADSFTQKPPNERKKILGEILNLQEYDELLALARGELRLVEGRLNDARTRIAVLDQELVKRPGIEEDLRHTSAELTLTGEQLDAAESLKGALALQITAWEQVRELLATARERAARDEAAIARFDAGIAGLHLERAERLKVIEQAGEIERGVEDLRRWREVADRFSVVQRQVHQQVAIQNAAQREIDSALAVLQRDHERHEQARRTADERLARMQQDETRLAELRRQSENDARALATLDSTRETLARLRLQHSTLLAENVQLKERMTDIKDRVDRIKAGDADCPVCRRPLSSSDRARIEREWTAEGTTLGARYRANKERLKENERESTTGADEEQRLVEVERRNTARGGMIAQLEASLIDRDAVQVQRDAARAEVERLDGVIAAEAFAPDARARLHEAETALVALDYDPGAHDEATRAIERLAPFVERARELDQARARLDSLERELATLAEQRQEREAALATARQEEAALEARLTDVTDVRERFQEASDEVERLSLARNRLNAQLGGIERELLRLDEAQIEREQFAAESAALAADQGALRELTEAFGRNGIQAAIVENVLPELEDGANELLRRMAAGQLHVSFRSQRQALSRDDVIETLDILIRDDEGERPYALYSGGESFRVNFAVRVALAKLLARRAGANVDMLVIDEGFGTQDSQGRDGLIEALRSVENDFRTILVITHIGEIRELFPTRIDVVKTERGSMLSVN